MTEPQEFATPLKHYDYLQTLAYKQPQREQAVIQQIIEFARTLEEAGAFVVETANGLNEICKAQEAEITELKSTIDDLTQQIEGMGYVNLE